MVPGAASWEMDLDNLITRWRRALNTNMNEYECRGADLVGAAWRGVARDERSECDEFTNVATVPPPPPPPRAEGLGFPRQGRAAPRRSACTPRLN